MDKKKISKILKLTLPPLITAVFMLTIFACNGIYPFGELSIVWSDGVQCYLPLLADFKDILEGKSSLFLNFQLSGGANFYGTFLFLLSSPFSLLVKFVDKDHLIKFFNILVLLKMMTISFCAAYSFSILRKKLELFWVVLFSLIYTFCGYVMMYYLIVGWLDMVYLFPLLVVGLDRIVKEQKPLMYIVILSLSCLFCYYITYMLAIFILLFMSSYFVLNYEDKDCPKVCRQILLSSLCSLLITAVVWLPAFMQYRDSARGEVTAVQSIVDSKLFMHCYETKFPLLMIQALPFVLILSDLFKKRKYNKEKNFYLLLLVFTFIPFIVEPINLMWHMGNYMAFPCRFSFITIFLALFCSTYNLEEVKVKYSSKLIPYAIALIGFALIFCVGFFVVTVLNNNISDIGIYLSLLSGNTRSIQCMSYIFVTIFALYGVVYGAYCRKCLSKSLFFIFLICIFLLESFVYVDIYFVYCAKIHKKSSFLNNTAYDLCDKIRDRNFYRVKSHHFFCNDNCVGALGYNSISGYTSLNNRYYMEMMKGLGYVGNWMEVASYGGTELTDALLSIKYEINGSKDKTEIYRSSVGSIKCLPCSLPMGLYLKKGSLNDVEFIPEHFERADIQSYISEYILGENIVKRYNSPAIVKNDGFYDIKEGTVVRHKVKIEERSSLYLDMYDHFSTSLDDPLLRATEVIVNGERFRDDYPGYKDNGLLHLGTYEDEVVSVDVLFKKDIKCKSFGLFSLDVGRLEKFCHEAQGANLNVKSSGLYAKCVTPKDCSLFVSLPYSDNFIIKVNGRRVDYKRVFSDFLTFNLYKGENEISLTFTPKGFTLGVIISCLGIIFSAFYVKFASKLDGNAVSDKVAKIITGAISVVIMLGIYILPVLIKLFC